MTYSPDKIYGPIFLNTSLTLDLPGLTALGTLGFAGTTLMASAQSMELYSRTTGIVNASGITSDYVGQLFLNNYFHPVSSTNLICGFIPNYYIDVFKNIEPTMNGNTGSVSFPGGAGSARDRYEIIGISFSKQIVLTNLAGATASVISNISVFHDIVPGNTTINGDYLFSRKLGRLPA